MSAIHFGKYKGKTYEEVAKIDAKYLLWLQSTLDPNDPKYGASNRKSAEEIDAVLNGHGLEKKKFTPKAPTGTVGSMDEHILEIKRMVTALYEKMNEAAPF